MSAEQLAVLFIGLLLGLGGQTNLVDFVKNVLKAEGVWAKLLAAGIAVITSTGALLITGGLGIADFTLENFPVVFSAVYVGAEFLYYFSKNGK